MGNKKTILYTRVSTEEQAQGGYSLEYQKNTLNTYCINNNYENVLLYEDGGYSGKNTKRPGYQKLVKEISENKIERVIFLKIDRLSRNKEDYFNFYKLCCGFNVELISLSEPITTTATGEFTQGILILLAEMERKQISERTKAGYVGKLQRGEYPFGGIMPLGISKDENNKLYYNKDIEQVKFIFSELSKGNTYQGVRRLFNKKYNKNNHINYIEEIAKRDIYKGVINYQGVEYKLLEPLKYKNYGINFKEYNFRERKNYKYIFKKYLKDFKVDTKYKKLKNGEIRMYRYYISKNSKLKMNENKIIKILENNIKKNKKERIKKRNHELKNLKDLLIQGYINKQEYEFHKKFTIGKKKLDIKAIKSIEIKNTNELIFIFKNSSKLKIKYDRNIV